MNTKSSFTLNIVVDEDPMNPREWDNLGKMVLFHNKYNVPNESECRTLEAAQEFLAENHKNIFWFPVYMIDHSGVALSTQSFNDPWDSGYVGFIYVEKSDVRKEWGVQRISKKIREIVSNNLIGEVETYSNYLNGDCYGYEVLDSSGDVLESCHGFYGREWAEQSGNNAISYLEQNPDYLEHCKKGL